MAPSTAQRIQATALDLFARRGFDEVTVEQVARAAGVSHMTFFRHFPTKESVVLADPWDPVIAAAVAATPADLAPLERVRRGLAAALDRMGDELGDDTELRVRLTAGHPRLRAAMWEQNQETAGAIAAALVATDVDEFDAGIAASACLGALTTALLDWGGATGGASLRDRMLRALAVLA